MSTCTARTEAPGPLRTQPQPAIVFGTPGSNGSGERVSVLATCEAIGLARSTYYYQAHRAPAAIEFENRVVLRLHELGESGPRVGYRTMTRLLQDEGFRVNPKRIARLMTLHGLSPENRGGSCGPNGARAPGNLLRNIRLGAAGHAWVAEMAYVQASCGLVYVASIVDAWSRDVLGYAISNQIGNWVASLALHAAVRSHHPVAGCIHHSTCGAQYRIRGYLNLLKRYGLTLSAPERTLPHAMSRIVRLNGYESWTDVSGNAQDFIQAIYTRERIEQILSRCGMGRAAHASSPGAHHTGCGPTAVGQPCLDGLITISNATIQRRETA